MVRRVVSIPVLPGEPTDGSGRVLVHLFVQDENGPFIEPSVLHPVIENGQVVKQRLQTRPTAGRLACDGTRQVAPVTRNGVTHVTLRTDEHRAVTCPKCLATEEYRRLSTA